MFDRGVERTVLRVCIDIGLRSRSRCCGVWGAALAIGEPEPGFPENAGEKRESMPGTEYAFGVVGARSGGGARAGGLRLLLPKFERDGVSYIFTAKRRDVARKSLLDYMLLVVDPDMTNARHPVPD